MDDGIRAMIDESLMKASTSVALSTSLANMNTIHSLIVILGRKGIIDQADIKTLSTAFKSGLNKITEDDSPALEKITNHHDQFIGDLLEILDRHSVRQPS